MFEKKFIDLLTENDIDIGLLIKRDEAEEDKFSAMMSNSVTIDTKTLSPIKIQCVRHENENLFVMMKTNDKAFPQDYACLIKHTKRMNLIVCAQCNKSTMDLCITNSIYKNNGMLVVKKEVK